MAKTMTIGRYLLKQLYDHGIAHVFGVPGDYSLTFLKLMGESKVAFVGTSDEQGAGFAADAYARLGGLGAVCVTYAVGSLKVANAAAQAYAERSPVVILCGSPGVQERARHPLLHHRVNEFDTQYKVFQNLTAAATVLDNAETAYAEIDRCLHAAQQHKRPVYIELPRDMVHVAGLNGHKHVDVPCQADGETLAEALGEAAAMIDRARHPVLIAGEEMKRFGLQAELLAVARKTGIPIAVTFLGKSAVREDLPDFIGVYAGVLGPVATRKYVEASDCFILLGMMMTDMNLGAFTAHMDRSRMILANVDGVSIRHHQFGLRLDHFVRGLAGARLSRHKAGRFPRPPVAPPFKPAAAAPITVRRLMQRLNSFLTDDMVVLADVGDSLFGSIDLMIGHEGRFLSSAYYSSMGFAVPGSVGAQLLDRRLRPLVLVGDGAFQMTGVELSTSVRLGLSPIVVVLNNGGYATERFFLDGSFNEIQPWNFANMPLVLGGGKGFCVTTEDELEEALASAKANTGGFSLLDVRLGRGDVSDGLRRLGKGFGKTVQG